MSEPDARLQAILDQLSELTRRCDETDAKLGDSQQRGYQPVPTVPWWQLHDRAREMPLARLRHWVDEVFRPSYGHLAAQLPDCWADHDLCLFYLDWLSELWNSLYVPPKRTQRILAAQAELSTRALPAAVERMAAEAKECQHARQRRTG